MWKNSCKSFTVLHTSQMAFLIKENYGGKSNVNVVAPPELKMICVKSNEINGEENCFVFDC